MRKRSLMGFFFLAFDIGGAGIPKTSHDVFLCLFFLASDGNGNAAGRTG